jgi:predicted Zn-dependent protease
LGKLAYEAGDMAWAASLLQESARAFPADLDILQKLAWATYCTGDVATAETMMQRLEKEAPEGAQREDARLFLKMVSLARKPDELAAAANEIEAVLKKDPAYLPALTNQAALQMALGKPKEASEAYAGILARSPDFALAQKALAALCVDFLNQPDRARELVNKARKTLPNDPELAQVLATVQFKKGEFTAGIETLKELSRKKPLDAKGLFVLGMCQVRGGDKAEGQHTLTKALQAGLKDPFARDAKWALKMLDSPGGAAPDPASGLSPL